MVLAEWGTKRLCQSCGALFYDFDRDPIICPKCGAEFDLEAILKSRRVRGQVEEKPPAEEPKKVAPPAAAEEAEEAEEEDDLDLPEVEEEDEEIDEDLVAEEDGDDLIEDTSDLGEDDADMAEVMEHRDSKEEG